MSFMDFTFPGVEGALGLSVREDDLFHHVPAVPIRPEFAAVLEEGSTVALAMNTEKGKSEFIIAPLLLELRRMMPGRISLFSGIALNVDPERGLTGVCDFVVSADPRQFVLTAPLVTIVESKNDNLRTGLGQCIAEMYAAREFNQAKSWPAAAVHGVVTTGSAWKFLKLAGDLLTIDLREYYIDDTGRILGILKHIVEQSIGAAP